MKEFIELNVNMDMVIKNVKLVELNISIATVYTNFKDNLIEQKFLCCNKNYQHKFDENLKERFFNTYKCLSLCNAYKDDWEKFNKTSLPKKTEFYNHLNMEDITDGDYAHAKRVCKDFEIKNLGEYHDLYIQHDASLLADVFDSFRNMCLEIYEHDPAKFLSDPWLDKHL